VAHLRETLMELCQKRYEEFGPDPWGCSG